MKDYYKTLGVNRNATKDEIKNAYRQLAKKHHPDSNPGDDGAQERFSKINEAYATLYDNDKRDAYDRKTFGGSRQQPNGANETSEAGSGSSADRRSNINYQDFTRTSEILEDFFSFNPKTKKHNLNQKDENIKPMKTKDAFDAIFGKKRF